MLEVLENFIRLRRALSLAHLRKLKPLGLGPRQAVILRVLDKDGPCSAVAMARATVSDPAAINRAVAGLLAKGFLRRVSDPRDGRRCRLSLTPGTGRLMARKVKDLTAGIAEAALSPLNPAERRRFNRTLERLTDHINANLQTAKEPAEDSHDRRRTP